MMNLTLQDPIEKLLELWLRYSTVNKNQSETKEEVRSNRMEIKNALEKKGVKEVEIFGMENEDFILRYLYKGNKLFKKVCLSEN